MKRIVAVLAIVLVLAVSGFAGSSGAGETLDIYFLDMAGGGFYAYCYAFGRIGLDRYRVVRA